jgi:hypothetical protein
MATDVAMCWEMVAVAQAEHRQAVTEALMMLL